MEKQEYEQLTAELEHYQNLLNQIDASISNLHRTKSALLEFKTEDSKEILAPIANGVYVEAEIKSKDLLVNIGSDIVSKKSIDEAIEIITSQEKEINVDREKVAEKINEIQVFLQNKGE